MHWTLNIQMHKRLGFDRKNRDLDIVELKNNLLELGVTPKYMGYYYFVEAYQIAIDNPWSLTLITKLIYPAVAKRYRTTTAAVEIELRRVRDMMWRSNPDLVSQLCHRHFSQCPSVSLMLSAFVGLALATATDDAKEDRA